MLFLNFNTAYTLNIDRKDIENSGLIIDRPLHKFEALQVLQNVCMCILLYFYNIIYWGQDWVYNLFITISHL